MLKKIFFLLIISFTSIVQAGIWKLSDYKEFNYKSFAKSNWANNIIDPKNIDISLLNAAIFYETNRQRVLTGLKEFKHSPALEKVATDHSKDMARLNFFSNTSPVPGKKTMSDRLRLVGISNTYTAENIADNFLINHPAGVPYIIRSDGYYYQEKKIRNRTYLEMAQSFLDHWMRSPGLRRNILNPNGIYLGAGAAAYGTEKKLRFKATQNFSSIAGKSSDE